MTSTSGNSSSDSKASKTPPHNTGYASGESGTGLRGIPDLATGSRRNVVTTDIAASKTRDKDIAMDSVLVKTHQVQEVEVEGERGPSNIHERQGSQDPIVRTIEMV